MRTPFPPGARAAKLSLLVGALVLANSAPAPAAEPRAASSATRTVTVTYDTPACGATGAATGHPLISAPIELRGPGGKVVAEGRTNFAGRAQLKVPSGAGPLTASVKLSDSNLEVTNDALFKSVYRFDLGPVTGSDASIRVTATPPGKSDTGVAPFDRDAAGAMNIWSSVTRAATFARNALRGDLARLLKPLSVRYRKGVIFGKQKDIDWSWYRNGQNELSIGGGPKNPHEFADDVIFHEYGHYLMDQLNISPDTPGGDHTFEKSYPDRRGLALSEGFASAFAAWAQGKVSKQRGGCTQAVASLTTPERKVKPVTFSEWHVAAALRDALQELSEQAGTASPGLAFRAMVFAFRKFGTGARAPQDLREARDALLSLESDPEDHSRLDQAFATANVGWGVQVEVLFDDDRDAGGFAHNRLTSVLDGPGLNCTANGGDPRQPLTFPAFPFEWYGKIGARGGLDYTFHDDCLTDGGAEDELNQFVWLLYPYTKGRSQLYNGRFRLTTTYTCRNDEGTDQTPPYVCTDDRRIKIRLRTGTGYTTEAGAVLSRDQPTLLLSFRAKGACLLVPSQEDCELERK